MKDFRTVSSPEEISKILARKVMGDSGIIWQTCEGDRMKWPILDVQAHEENILMGSSQKIQVNKSFPVYVKFHHRSMVFKLNIGDYDFLGSQLICRYPKEAKAVEDRKATRTSIPEKVSLFLTLRSIGTTSLIDIKVRIYDISEFGIGGAVSRVNRDFFQRNNIFQIVKIGEQGQLEPNILTLKHITDPGKSHKVKLGFALDLPLSDSFFNTLRDEMKKSILN